MRVPAQLLKAVAAVFVLAMTTHSAGLIYYNRHSFPTATIGATYVPPNGRGAMPITQVVAQGPAERAGLKEGDLVVKVEGYSVLEDEGARGLARLELVEMLRLTVRRDGKDVEYVSRVDRSIVIPSVSEGSRPGE